MTTGAIITAVIMALIFAVGLIWCFKRWSTGSSKWED